MSLHATHSADLSAQELEKAIALGWNPVCHITYSRDAWVKLLQPLSAYSFQEAKLLCQAAADRWVAWVPDHGEVILNRSDFYC
ncbi:MAG: hypothetical protein Fur0046_24270 [Cyanobacteria bacterium J069]|nr:MAG: hypothetical protein D6742_20555 [Cyanobacteria bacterium J069]